MSTAPHQPNRLKELRQQLRLLLGLRNSTTIDGVRYVERTHEPLRRAISSKGKGFKDYEVTFRDGERMRIRYTPDRVYADLVGPPALAPYRPADELIRPGMRLLELDAGSGYGAAWLAQRVGPAGAIVALEEDGESAHFAKRRYLLSNVAIERGSTEALEGELNGSFEGIIALRVLREQTQRAARLKELWRVLAPAGWLMVGGPAAGESITSILIECGVPEPEIALADVLSRGPEGAAIFLVRKGAQKASEERDDEDDPSAWDNEPPNYGPNRGPNHGPHDGSDDRPGRGDPRDD